MNLFKIFGTIAVKNGEANNAVDETADKAGSASSAITGAFKKIGAAVVTYFAADKIKDFGREIVNCSAEVSAEQSAFAQIMGDYSRQAQEKLQAVADATGMLDTRLTPYMTSMTAKFKGLGYGVEDSTDLAQRGLTLAADAAAFWDKSLEDSMGGLNSFINGSYEGGEAIGLFANDTQMASYAVQQGIIGETKEWANLDEARKQATRLQYAEDMYKMSGATGQAAKESGQYANIQANLTEKWRQFKAQIGEPVLQNIVIPAMSKLSEIVDKASTTYETAKSTVSGFTKELKEHEGTIKAVGSAIGIAVTAYAGFKAGQAIQSVVNGFQRARVTIALFTASTQGASIAQATLNGTLTIGEGIVALLTGKMTLAQLAQAAMTKGQAMLNAVMSANPIGLVVAALAALTAGFIYLWNTSESFRNFWIDLWKTIKNAASNAWNAIKSVIDTIKAKCQELGQRLSEIWSSITSAVSAAIESIRSAIAEKFEAAKQIVINIFTAVSTAISIAWETIKNIVQAGIMFVVELITAAFQLITLPWQFIWENCKQYIMAAWEAIKTLVTNALTAIETTISNVWNAIVAFLSPLLEGIKNTFITIWNAISSAIATVSAVIQNVITTAWNAIRSTVSSILNAISSVVSSIWNSIKSTVSGIVSSIQSTVSSVFNAISSFISSVLNSIKSTFSNIWNSIKSTVSNAIDEIKSTISDGINSAKSTVSSVLESIKDKFNSIFESAKNIVKSGIDTIKGFFDFSWSLPSLKLPHFSISGSFSLDPPSVPHFGVEWYKKAMDNPMVLDEATIFGYNPSTGKALGAGEAGQEIISGAGTLKTLIREAVAAEQNGNEDKVAELLQTLLNWLSNGGLRDVMIDVLTKHVKLKWENRELARLVRTYA